jgi:hypothetical protein
MNLSKIDNTSTYAALAIYLLYHRRGQNSVDVCLVNSGQFSTRYSNFKRFFIPNSFTEYVFARKNYYFCEIYGFLVDQNVDALLTLLHRTIISLTQQFEEPIKFVDFLTVVSQEVEFLTEIDDIFTIDIHEPINSKYDNDNFNTAYEDYPQHQEIDLNFAGVYPQQSTIYSLYLFAATTAFCLPPRAPSQKEADATKDDFLPPLAPSHKEADATADDLIVYLSRQTEEDKSTYYLIFVTIAPSHRTEEAEALVPLFAIVPSCVSEADSIAFIIFTSSIVPSRLLSEEADSIVLPYSIYPSRSSEEADSIVFYYMAFVKPPHQQDNVLLVSSYLHVFPYHVIFDNVVYETSYPRRALIQFNDNFDSFDNRLKSDNLISLLIWKSSCRRALKVLTDPALEFFSYRSL